MRALLVVFLIASSTSSFAQMKCDAILPIPAQNATEQTIDQSIHSLAKLRTQLDIAAAEGRKSLALRALAHDYATKENQMIQFLEKNHIMSREEMFAKMDSAEEKSAVVQRDEALERERVEQVRAEFDRHANNGETMVFRNIPAGKGKIFDSQKDYEIKKPFQMASTLVTQHVWKQVAQAMKDRQKETQKFEFFYLQVDPSYFKGDLLPVNGVSKEQVELWLRAANELAREKHPLAAQLFPGTEPDTYLALPTNEQWDYVAHKRGTYAPANENPEEIDQMMWSKDNSNNQPHDVALKRPLAFEGQSFYDLYGNVNEWTKTEAINVSGFAALSYNTNGIPVFVRGGSFSSDPKKPASDVENRAPRYGNRDGGFRLVRMKNDVW